MEVMADDRSASSDGGVSTAMPSPVDDSSSEEESWRPEPSSGTDEVATAQGGEKDRRKIPRKYQLELCRRALEENVIVCLETGSGKTHIAVLVMYEMRHLIKKPEMNVFVFLAPTVALVQQQARVITESTNFKVGLYCGEVKHLKSHADWHKQLEEHEVLVMTPQILLHSLSHCFIRMEMIMLLVFDECHYAHSESNHPYAEIMKLFYHDKPTNLPRIFGMTASPVVGKGGSIASLESLLNAKVYSVEDREELESYISSPSVGLRFYTSDTINLSKQMCLEKLDETKRECMSILRSKGNDHNEMLRTKKLLHRFHNNLVFCLRTLGTYGALIASRILLNGDQSARHELLESNDGTSDDHLYNVFLSQTASLFSSHCFEGGVEPYSSHAVVLEEQYFSRKVLCLIEILSNFRDRPDTKCIIFVNRIIIARSLCCVLQQLKGLESWRCGCLVGIHNGLKSMSRKIMNKILDDFRSDKLNLLVATKVGEEGLDIQTCCLVVRFDLPDTVASFIQSRGRARMPQSEYIFLVDRENEKEINLIEKFKKDEDKMNIDIVSRNSNGKIANFEERIYAVDSTGAKISAQSSISLLYHYCSKLPRDEYFNPCPELSYINDVEGMKCHIILPSNAMINQIVSEPQSSMEAAKRDACLKACKQLHETGALTDFLLPDVDNSNHDISEFSDSDEEASRGELHEMLVPAVLREPWLESKNPVGLNSYFLKFIPEPQDRQYKEFGLFIKAPLPDEAENLKLDLHLSHSRSVMAELVPCGVTELKEEEILLAQNFQEMFLKIILDRSKFESNIVPFENALVSYPETTAFYLLLPVIQNESMMIVDWKTIRKCLSSPVFGSLGDVADTLDGQLQLVDGPVRASDIVNSLVYAPHKKLFFFVSQILHDKNGYSLHNASSSHVEHLKESFGIQLSYPEQPLLQAKQLFCLRNLLHDRKHGNLENRELEEHFFELPPELCQLKILGFSKEIGSSLSLLPSVMHRLESLLVAIELKKLLSSAFPEGAQVTAQHVLEALTTEKCLERFSLERFEVLGDAFLKFAVGRHLFLLYDTMDEGWLTRKRSETVNNSNLYKLALRNNLQVYIRDEEFDAAQFYAFGRPFSVLCTKETEECIHARPKDNASEGANYDKLRCSKNHRFLYKKTIADVVEALIGAYIVDGGFKVAIAFLKWIGIKVDFEISKVHDVCLASDRFCTSLSSRINFSCLENELGYKFLHKGLILQAFIHPSFNRLGGGCYQRLEYLGDAVLDYLITSYLYSVYPNLKPGQLTHLRSVLVNNESFARVAVNRSFHQYIICECSDLSVAIDKYVKYMQASSSIDVPEESSCPKALGDLVESCIGAILLDSGFDLNLVWKVMLSLLNPTKSFSSLQINLSRDLRELCQCHGWELEYLPSKCNESFRVEARVNGKGFCESAVATNSSRKVAERIATKQVYAKLKAQGYKLKSKSLEEILQRSCKHEAKLIGWDEKPVPIWSSALRIEELTLKEAATCEMKPLHLKSDLACMITTASSFTKERSSSFTVENDNPGSITKDEKSIPVIEDLTPEETANKEKPLHSNSDLTCTDTSASSFTVESSSPLIAENSSLNITGGLHQGKSAKARLKELCDANYWKNPQFECCSKDGPTHVSLFTCKVVLEIDEIIDGIPGGKLECYGVPQPRKKDAAEQASLQALWFLEKRGFILG